MSATSASNLLKIDAAFAVENLENFIRRQMEDQPADGILLGLSGGIDSCLLASVAVRAARPQRVHAVYLYDRDSSPVLGRRARSLAEGLGVDLQAVSIDAEMQAQGIHASPVMQATALAGWSNRLLHGLYRLVSGESAFVTALKRGAKGIASDDVVGSVESGMSARHIYRGQYLEQLAAKRSWLLLGAANRSEWLTGWFVKGGVDDLPIQPLIGLYKTQVRQLAAYLDVPEEIIRQAPSPDMRKGITDEIGLGMAYWRIDLALDHLTGGLTREQLESAGVTPSQIEYVRKLNRLSAWKRSGEASMPADGGPGGGLRLG